MEESSKEIPSENETEDGGEELNPMVKSLVKLTKKLEDYEPVIPDAVTNAYLEQSGLNECDIKIVRLVSLAAQKFISDIANDTMLQCTTRTLATANSSRAKAKERRLNLAMEDLALVLAENNIIIKKPAYFL